MKESDILENVFDSKNTEGPCDLEALGGDEEDVGEDSTNGSELENKKSDDHEYKTKLSSDLNEIHSSGFLDENGEESANKGDIKKTDERALLTNPKKNMFKRRRALKKTLKEYRADTPQMKSESISSTGEKEIEENKSEGSLFEETRKRGRDLNWQQVECFDSPQAFNRSQIKAELDQVMSRSKSSRTSEARQERYVCKFYKKSAWKPCLRKYRVSHLNTSFAIVVSSTLDEHHHEEDPEYTTLDYYHWTVQQEKVPSIAQ